MKYPQIIGKVVKGFWTITEEKHYAILSALEARLGGQAVFMGEDDDEADDCSNEYQEYGSIAIIPVRGILGKHLSSMEMDCGGCSMDAVRDMLEVADQSPRITKIVLNMDTPGGTVTGTPELGDFIEDVASRKPVIAYTDTECCSGGLWLASKASQFYCAGSATTGSCGVRMILLDTTKMLDNEGIKVNPIFSGKYKLSGASFKVLEPDEREMFQAESDRVHAQFKDAVNTNRSVDEKFLQGQLFRGEAAAEIGMVDGVCDSLDELLDLISAGPLT